MSKEPTSITELAEYISNVTYLLGIAVGWEEASKAIRAEAGEIFAKGNNDQLAQTYRDLAQSIKVQASKKRQEYDKQKPQKESAFKLLEQIEKGIN